MQPEQEQEIARLRTLRLTPKQIARKLGLKVSEVNTVIRGQAEQTTQVQIASGELNCVTECWVNQEMAKALLNPQKKGLLKRGQSSDDGVGGLGNVWVARQGRNDQLLVCSYLVDYWCLGVKDAWGPRKFKDAEYQRMLSKIFDMFPGRPQRVTLPQAQAIVFSAVEYAEALGLRPHRDFKKARSHLGDWDGQNRVECGKDGKPFYIAGPHDNSTKIIRTLTQTVGEDNFHYVVPMELGDGPGWF